MAGVRVGVPLVHAGLRIRSGLRLVVMPLVPGGMGMFLRLPQVHVELRPADARLGPASGMQMVATKRETSEILPEAAYLDPQI